MTPDYQEAKHQETELDVAVMFQVCYDTPAGDARLTITGYTSDAVAYGVRCQFAHRPSGEDVQRSMPMGLEESVNQERRAPVLDGDALYLYVVDAHGHDLAVSKIDEAKWPVDATPTTVRTKSYWLYVPAKNLVC